MSDPQGLKNLMLSIIALVNYKNVPFAQRPKFSEGELPMDDNGLDIWTSSLYFLSYSAVFI